MNKQDNHVLLEFNFQNLCNNLYLFFVCLWSNLPLLVILFNCLLILGYTELKERHATTTNIDETSVMSIHLRFVFSTVKQPNIFIKMSEIQRQKVKNYSK